MSAAGRLCLPFRADREPDPDDDTPHAPGPFKAPGAPRGGYNPAVILARLHGDMGPDPPRVLTAEDRGVIARWLDEFRRDRCKARREGRTH